MSDRADPEAELFRDERLLQMVGRGEPADDPAAQLLLTLRAQAMRVGGLAAQPAVAPLGRQRQEEGQAVRRRRVGRRVAAIAVLLMVVPTSGVAAAASAHPGDLLYGVRRVVLGRTADDPHAAAALLHRAEVLTGRAFTTPPRERAQVTRQTFEVLRDAHRRIQLLHPRDAVVLSRRLQAVHRDLRAILTGPGGSEELGAGAVRGHRPGDPRRASHKPLRHPPTHHPRAPLSPTPSASGWVSRPAP
jgi:hypothetical protein